MADDTTINQNTTVGDKISSDEVTTLNGAASSGVKVQRMKVGFGVENDYKDITATNPLPVINTPEGAVSTANSSVANLAASAVFTGTAEDVTIYSNIKINVYSSHVSATDGLSFQQSHDGIFWPPVTDIYSIPAITQRSFSIAANMKFFRVVYTNGATLTTTLVIQVLYHKSNKQASSVRPQDARGNDNDFIEQLCFLMGYNSTTNVWDRLRTTIANGLAVDVTRMPTTAVTGTFFQATQPVSLATNTPDVTDRAARLLGVVASIAGALPAGTNALGNINELRAATLAVTVTAATGTAATLSLPAVAAQFHYITSIEARLYSTAARTGAATPILVTTTNIPGTPSLTFDTAGAIGTSVAQQPFVGATPVKSLTVNTATTIVAPIVTGGIWRITVTYFTAA